MKDPINILEVKKEERRILDSEIKNITLEARSRLVEDLKSLVFKISNTLEINIPESIDFINEVSVSEFSDIRNVKPKSKKLVRLSSSDISEISKKLKTNFKVKDLAEEYGVSYSRINLVKKNLGLCKTRKSKTKSKSKTKFKTPIIKESVVSE